MDRAYVEGNPFPSFGISILIYGRFRNIWAAESCLRRALEALFDLGRDAVTEYKEIAVVLNRRAVISAEDTKLMQKLARYRNRLVHFYHDVSENELYEICASHLGDIEKIANALRVWLKNHPNN